MYPLRFKPIFRQYIWGGRRLGTQLGKDIGPEDDYAESWEIVDHGEDQSIVAFGNLQGRTLSSLIDEYGSRLLGNKVKEQIDDPRLPESLQNRFPLLFKFLDANRTLSVQVHPNDDLAMLKEPPDLGKTEAWYVIDADGDAKIFAGLKQGVDPDGLFAAAEAGETDSVLHSFSPQPGDCVFIPAGAVHAIGEGLLVAEIQQSSDTTFRLFDWNRVDKNGNTRELHVQEAVHSTDYNLGPVHPQVPKPTDRDDVKQLVRCSKFVMNRWQTDQPINIFPDDRFRILAVTAGEIQIENDPSGSVLLMGQTALLPACLDKVAIQCNGQAEFLEIYVP